MVNIYVGNLPFTTTEDDLRELFSAHGEVTRSSIIIDRETGRSRGFGFVEMANDEQARAAIAATNGQDYGGRPLKVNEAQPKEQRGGGGGGGGGWGGRGGGGGGGGWGGRGGGGGGGGGGGWGGRGGGRGGDRGGDRGGRGGGGDW
ncbi:MAG: RNA recognition motif domain-containing protein [Phycisphaerales bacterium]|jgi:RNA recognition motif-containing protein